MGPEISFDALWYHLTLPKIYLENHSIMHIPGGLYYYSEMPKLIEMFYTSALSVGSETYPKLIHFGFGILTIIGIYCVARKFVNSQLSLIACIIFYSNLVVGWESITAYIDLARAFFEVMALWGFLNYLLTKKRVWLVESGILVGLAAATKLIALGSVIVFISLIVYLMKKSSLYYLFRKKDILTYFCTSIFVLSPWLIIAYVNTGNPLYPFFSNIYPLEPIYTYISPFTILKTFWSTFIMAADPLNPIYLILLPLSLLYFRSMKVLEKVIGLYCLFAIIIWYFTPHTGGGRFLLPYLPMFSVLSAIIIQKIKGEIIKKIFISVVIMLSGVSILYRGAANIKFIPVIIGVDTKEYFLSRHLNYGFGNVSDTDGYLAKTIKKDDTVLVYGGHNLFYLPFRFIHETYVKKGDRFNYILTIRSDLPKRFARWKLIYQNNITQTKLYTFDKQEWIY